MGDGERIIMSSEEVREALLAGTNDAADRANIPVHPNVGMGVCGVPMFEVSPIDAVTRTSKALVLIGKADGL